MGQRQRTAVARATVARPAVLLADEPTSHQDVGHATAVVDALRGVTAAGGGVLVASHDPLIVSAADRLVSLDPL
jgi:putative ABC transport system ATP-binding protein